jgi:hypothetical protein
MSTQIKVEKAIPIPQDRNKYPFKTMEVGDSFFVPANGEALQRVQNRVSNSWKRHASKRFLSRQIDGGVRVWRIE